MEQGHRPPSSQGSGRGYHSRGGGSYYDSRGDRPYRRGYRGGYRERGYGGRGRGDYYGDVPYVPKHLRNKEESTSEAKRTKAPVKKPAQQKPIDDDDFDWGAPEKKVDSKQKQDTSAQKP